jgi:hypothetical protein
LLGARRKGIAQLGAAFAELRFESPHPKREMGSDLNSESVREQAI